MAELFGFSIKRSSKDVASNEKSFVSPTPDDGTIEAKNKMSPEKTKLDGGWEDALYDIAGQIDRYGGDFAYIWYEEDGDWAVIKNTGTRSMIDQLANQLASAAMMYGPVDENKELKKENMYIDDDEFEMEMVVDRVKEIKPLFPGIDNDILVSFVKTHRQDIRGASDEDIKDEFDEFMSVNTEYIREEDNIEVDSSDATAGDDAIERESASGAFEEAVNWRGETLKEQFKRLIN